MYHGAFLQGFVAQLVMYLLQYIFNSPATSHMMFYGSFLQAIAAQPVMSCCK